MTDISNNIIYPSFFKINYEDTKNTFYLESLTLSNLKLWKNSILIDSSNNITIQHREFSKLIMNLKACLTDKLLLVHKSSRSLSRRLWIQIWKSCQQIILLV